MAEVSVVFSIYGFQPDEKIEIICDSIKRQTVSCDIILAEQSEKINPYTFDFCQKNNIKYVHSIPNIIKENCIKFNPGRARNACLNAVTTEYIYFSDSDIFFENINYIQSLLSYGKRHPKTALIRPKIKRLSSKSIFNFINDYKQGIPIGSMKTLENCYIDYDPVRKIFSSTYPIERYSLIHNILHVSPEEKFVDNEYDPKYFSEFNWSVLSHFGGLFCTKTLFKSIGGYTEDYLTWGMEDTDIQWKFDTYSGIQLIDNIVHDFSLIHFEHENRCQNEDYSQNYKIFEIRKKTSFEQILKHDKENLNRSLIK